jgi:hypothetical protein
MPQQACIAAANAFGRLVVVMMLCLWCAAAASSCLQASLAAHEQRKPAASCGYPCQHDHQLCISIAGRLFFIKRLDKYKGRAKYGNMTHRWGLEKNIEMLDVAYVILCCVERSVTCGGSNNSIVHPD